MFNHDIIIQVNGESFTCPPSMKLIDLLLYLDFDIRFVAVEYNSKIVSRLMLRTINLKHKDKLEVITIVGGG